MYSAAAAAAAAVAAAAAAADNMGKLCYSSQWHLLIIAVVAETVNIPIELL